jgi:hypothetical protein
MSGKHGFYSDVIVYDERTRYYYMWAQKNKPLLDDEIRNMGIGLLDQIRRGLQHTYGDVAAPNSQYSKIYSAVDSFKVVPATDTANNFLVKGGVSLDQPAVLYAKGFYMFLTKDIEYKLQTYSTDNIDINTESDKTLTLTPIPTITTPSSDRIDIVYVSLHFNEVSAVTGTDPDVYRDSNLKNPIVGTETANRLRAVIDVKVHENWDTITSPITKDIFDHTAFLGSINSNDSEPTANVYNIPIAAIYRTAFSDSILSDQIVDLLSLYNKRICSLEEISYRITHGGYSTENLADQSLDGFSSQFPGGTIDEGAFATGLNMGLDTEAFNSNSVTPRVLDSNGKYFVQGMMVGNDPDLVTLETGPVDLGAGEMIVQDISARSIYVGYGDPGVTGMREYTDTVSVARVGVCGRTLVSITNQDGSTGSITFNVKAVRDGEVQNYVAVDYDGRMGLNTLSPGTTQPDPMWATDRYNDGLQGETGINILLDANGSVQIRDHLLVEKDIYVEREIFGRTWRIPEAVSSQEPMLVGFTGIPQDTGFTGSIAFAVFKRGVALLGETGISAYGYTGAQVAYEAYDAEGNRLFSIGDIGNTYDRTVRTLYGMGINVAYLSDYSLMTLPSPFNDSVTVGDVVSYSVRLEDSSVVIGTVTLTLDGWGGIEEIRTHILNNIGFPADPNQGYTGMPYSRMYPYQDYRTDGTIATETGMAYGVQLVEDVYGYSGMGGDQHGRLIIKDLVSGADPIKIEDVESFTIYRAALPTVLTVPFTKYHYYGSGGYGGDFSDIKFAKLDLGEAADGWLFNGDVYFNGNGLLNRVTFSPNVIFRDDVFVYGTIYSNEQVFNFATIQNLTIKNNLTVEKKGYFKEGASFGDGANVVYETLRATDENLDLFIKNKGMSNEIVLRGSDLYSYLMGILRFTNMKDSKVSAYIGGTPGSTLDPFGLHLIDDRNVSDDQKLKSFTIDFSDGRGNYSDVSLVLNGDLATGRYFQSQYLGVGPIDQINTDYRLQVQGRALINDVLEVKALRFVGAEAPEGSQDIIDPSNISVIGRITDGSNGEEYQNNQIILREKKFTSTKRIYLNNRWNLGYSYTTDPQEYYNNTIEVYYSTQSEATPARWAFDNISYTESQFNQIAESSPDTSPDEIVVEDITLSQYKKFRCERVRIASLGTLMIEWTGSKFNPDPVESCIQQYYFTSPYFRNRDGGINVDWFPEVNRFGDDNFVAHVRADFVNTDASSPTIYSIDKSIGLYIPKSAWWQYLASQDENGYQSFAIYYPFENIVSGFNAVNFSRQNPTIEEVEGWKLVLYPRLIKQRRVTVGSNLDKIYTGEWSLDLCIISEDVGKIANMVGKLAISYFQS